jgi:IS30 family transposase
MAERLGAHKATIYRELRRGGVSRNENPVLSAYNPEVADSVVAENVKRRGWGYDTQTLQNSSDASE